VFRAVDFGHDPRQRPVRVVLFARNFLIGGVPGSGKSYGARVLALAALLDPTCELKIAEFKGTGDFTAMAELASTYICGIDDRALDEGGALIAWGLAEAERRAARVLRFKKAGLAPEGKVTPELAARPGSGLHPVVIVVDEAHELFAHDKDIAADAERLIKRGRALGLILVLATQVPDAKSVPANITRCVTVRWCMAVRGQVENDMILGTGAYKRGLSATSFRPGDDEDPRDAGLGVMVGLAHPAPAVRSYYPTQAETVALLRRAAQLRGGVLVASEGGPAARDVLDDVRGVFYAGEAFVSWQTITARLAEQLPEHYGSMTVEAIGARVRGLGVVTTDGRDRALGGKALKGATLASVQDAISRRQIGAGREPY
jgi:DNA segregation ATPase FtsK/SpoIIIE, S-DNA-T family